jgi:hypothetical protein
MKEIQFQRTVDRLKKVNEVVKELDPAIRGDAFALLVPYVNAAGGELGDDPEKASANKGSGMKAKGSRPLDEETLVKEFESEKDHENALLAVAILYGRHGKGPFDLALVRAIADAHKLNIPDRPDKTFKVLKRDGSPVLRKQSDGSWKITQGGKNWLRKAYPVKRGKQPIPS